MESKYDRVAYPENVYLHSDTEDFGTGVYPVSVISHKKFRQDSFKIACIKVRRKHRTALFVGIGLAVFLLFLLIIIPIAARSKPSSNSPKDPCSGYDSGANTNNKKYGLFFQPQVKDSSLICYSKDDTQSWLQYVSLLDFHTNAYSRIEQTASEGYVSCTNDTAPVGKKCQFDIGKFSQDCSHGNHYGYVEERPCVMLTLKLPEEEIVRTFGNDATDVKSKLGKGFSPGHIGVTCEGETAEDKKHIGTEKVFVERGGRKEDPIDITPPTGFPATYFSNGQTTLPSVMVGFNTLKHTEKQVHIKCVAWAKSFNNGQPESSSKYTARFSFKFL